MIRPNHNPLANKFARTMLASSCLVAASSAMAQTTVTEGSGGAPADFSNSLGSSYLLPIGTTVVHGGLTSGTDTADWFEFQGLTGNYQVHAFYNPANQERGMSLTLFNSSGNALGSATLEQLGGNTGAHLSGTAPANGEIFAEILGQAGGTYEVDFTGAVSAAPEPSAWAMMGVGTFAAGAMLRRKRRNGKAATVPATA
jgi:hypothetical protein